MRHGKSSWEHAVSDRDRPLVTKGIADTEKVARVFMDYDIKVDTVLCSPAERAFQTCTIFMSTLHSPSDRIIYDERLYDFSGNQVAKVITELNDSLSSVLIFGHNPAFTILANNWGDREFDNIPTAGLLIINFPILSWKDISIGGNTEIFIKPNEIKI